MTRRQILDEAIMITTHDREVQYGSPQSNFALAAEYWTVWLKDKLISPLDAHDVGIMMTLLKTSRIQTGQVKPDNYVDACGYLALAGEIAERGDPD